MTVLGIHGDLTNPGRHLWETGAAIVRDGVVLVAVSEERISRKKMDGAFPFGAVRACLAEAELDLSEIDAVAVADVGWGTNAARYLKAIATTFVDTGVVPLPFAKIGRNLRRLLPGRSAAEGHSESDRRLLAGLRDLPRHYVDHHLAHAAGAYFFCPFDEVLVVTLDGGGNGLDGAVYRARAGELEEIHSVPHFQSPGTMYSAITTDFGFVRHRHEGKITGLAAYGTPSANAMGLRDLIRYDSGKGRFVSRAVARHHFNVNLPSAVFAPLLEQFSREDLAATAQDLFEAATVAYVADALARYRVAGGGEGEVRLCVAGGCFANVKMNQRLREIDGIADLFVFPGMTDGGLAVGAALMQSVRSGASSQARAHERVRAGTNVYLGPTPRETDMEAALESQSLTFERPGAIEEDIGRLLATGHVVAHYSGRMEFGPRALGNRSILAAPFDASINDWLNGMLQRTEFMPFAPSCLFEEAGDYFAGWDPAHETAQFMTVTYDVVAGAGQRIPAVVHVDNTARPQIVRREDNPRYHAILSAFHKRSGIPIVLNTSFNMHEEPIVCTPNDAVRGFLAARVDYLAMGPFLVRHPDPVRGELSGAGR
jgi:carbamoyltransferase